MVTLIRANLFVSHKRLQGHALGAEKRGLSIGPLQGFTSWAPPTFSPGGGGSLQEVQYLWTAGLHFSGRGWKIVLKNETYGRSCESCEAPFMKIKHRLVSRSHWISLSWNVKGKTWISSLSLFFLKRFEEKECLIWVFPPVQSDLCHNYSLLYHLCYF